MIHHLFQKKEPFFVGRIAGIELQTAYDLLYGKMDRIPYDRAELENNAGIRTESMESLQTYVKKLIDTYRRCSLIGEWDTKGEVYERTGKGQELIRSLTPDIPKCDALEVEPYYVPKDDSWMSLVKGKRILIIHPFQETIAKQIPHLSQLFPCHEWFVDCTFQVIRPPLTLAGNHEGKDWQEHYRLFIESLSKEIQPFDLALVAGGGYGMLIAEELFTRYHSSVIYVGGALQLFFGILGKRWFTNKRVLELVTDDWIRPLDQDKPKNFQAVEKGCYW